MSTKPVTMIGNRQSVINVIWPIFTEVFTEVFTALYSPNRSSVLRPMSGEGGQGDTELFHDLFFPYAKFGDFVL